MSRGHATEGRALTIRVGFGDYSKAIYRDYTGILLLIISSRLSHGSLTSIQPCPGSRNVLGKKGRSGFLNAKP